MTYPSACIQIISSRRRTLPFCLRSINKYANPGNYPIFIHYFDSIYDSKIRRFLNKTIAGRNIEFIKVPYKSPGHVSEKQMFFNRKNFEYVRDSFPRSRKGYLHMCNFMNNIYGYQNTKIHKFDYLRVYDDECGYNKKAPFEPAKFISEKNIEFAAHFYQKRLKNGAPHSGHIATRTKLFDFLKFYLEKNNIVPRSKELFECIKSENPEWNFHYLKWADTYIIKTSVFKSKEWKNWIDAVNLNGGVYKYRWGDNEIYTLFGLMNYEYGVYDLGFVEKGIHHQSKFRKLQDIAPSIKNLNL